MKNTKLQTTLRKLAATAMAVAVMGTGMAVPKADEIQAPGAEAASVQSYHETVVAALFSDGPNYRTVKPYNNAEVILTISASCTGIAIRKKCAWSGELSGTLADAYTGGACSFGYNGSANNRMAKSYFTRYDKSKSDDATYGTECSNTMTKLYYMD